MYGNQVFWYKGLTLSSIKIVLGYYIDLEPVGTQVKLGLSEMILDAELIESGGELEFELGTSVSFSQWM